nr:FAD-binding domain-containing protein [Pelagicoccus albus]
MLSETEVALAALNQFKDGSARKFIDEVFWRTYWKGYLENRPQIWDRYREDLATLRHRNLDSDTLDSAINGTTGIRCFDYWTKELIETGYLHNHARMWFASIWIFTLKLPWQLGADFFLRHLLDGDPASNTLSWRWVAGLHTAGKSYLATSSNIDRYTNGRFPVTAGLAAEAETIRDAWPELDAEHHSLAGPPQEIPPASALLLLEEDLCDHCLPNCDFASFMGVFPSESYDEFSISPKVQNFRKEALKLRLQKLEKTKGVPIHSADTDLTNQVASWISQNGLKHVYYSQPKVGFWSDQWPNIHNAISDAGAEAHPFRLSFENRLFPHATAGFFKFRKRLPALLSELQDEAD